MSVTGVMSIFRKLNQLLGNFTIHDGVIVLMYHRVNDDLPAGELNVQIKEFAKQMFFLKLYSNKFQVMNVQEMIEFLKIALLDANKKTPRNDNKTKIVITFDDGYRDNYLYVYPILKRYNIPAVIFLTTDYIGTENKKDRYKDVPWKRDYLNMNEINEMVRSGVISFGAHTGTHPHLAQIGLGEAKEEIERSMEVVKQIASLAANSKTPRNDMGKGLCNDNTHHAARTPHDVINIPFCYPYGDYNGTVKEIVRGMGFNSAFSVKPGINYKGQDLFEIKRIGVLGQDNFASFKYKITDKYKL